MAIRNLWIDLFTMEHERNKKHQVPELVGYHRRGNVMLLVWNLKFHN
jgi:hypothetical protein